MYTLSTDENGKARYTFTEGARLSDIHSKTARVEFIRHKLATDDAWLYRGLLAIHARQTEDEKASKETNQRNSRGFNGTDAAFLSDLAEQVKRYGSLYYAKQIAACRRCMLKYAKQLETVAREKEMAAPSEVA